MSPDDLARATRTTALASARAPVVRAPAELVAGKYLLESPLAQGGMGSLWSARHVELDVSVAIKFSTMDRSAAHDARFRREARATARLRSPHVVHVYDYGIDRDEPYIAMELLDGQNLRELLAQAGRLSLGQAAALVAEIAEGLKLAHDAGIIHRDLKPSNLFLARSGKESVLKILDFGIAKASSDAFNEVGTAPATTGVEATRFGAVVGSPGYMSPEQARGELVDQRSDVWSLGAVAFRMLAGVELFSGPDPKEIMAQICSAPLLEARSLAPELPREIDDFFARALARRREDRFQSAEELSAALSRVSEHHPELSSERPLTQPFEANRELLARAEGVGSVARTGETRPMALDIAPSAASRPAVLQKMRALGGLGLGLGLALTVGLSLSSRSRSESARTPPTSSAGAHAAASDVPSPAHVAVPPATPSEHPPPSASASPSAPERAAPLRAQSATPQAPTTKATASASALKAGTPKANAAPVSAPSVAETASPAVPRASFAPAPHPERQIDPVFGLEQ